MLDPLSPELSLVAGQPVSRRRFLQTAGLMAVSGALAACAGTQQGTLFEVGTSGTATPSVVLPSPAAPEPTASPELVQFLALSAALTGKGDLDARLGQVYWESLQASGASVGALLEQAGLTQTTSHPTLATLQAAGVFDDPAARKLAGEIAKLWYTGVIMQDGEPAVAAFTDALAWKTLRFTKPASICGSFGFWAVQPAVEVFASSGPVAPPIPAGQS